MILITGATGNFGSSTAQHLVQRQIPFRGAARNLEALKKRFGSNPTAIPFFKGSGPDSTLGFQMTKSFSPVVMATSGMVFR